MCVFVRGFQNQNFEKKENKSKTEEVDFFASAINTPFGHNSVPRHTETHTVTYIHTQTHTCTYTYRGTRYTGDMPQFPLSFISNII